MSTTTDAAPTNGHAQAAAIPPGVRPRLAAFHRDPPRTLPVRMEARDHERLERYTRFYNEAFSADVAPADVAAAIVARFIERDRAFRAWDGRGD